MADTTVSQNNQQVRFRGRGEKEMPNVSEAQRGAMAAAAEGKSKLGIPEKTGKEFMAADEGGKLPKKKAAPDQADSLAKRGMISDKQLKKMRAKGGTKTESDKDDDGVDDAIEGKPESGGKLDAVRPPKGNKDGDADDR